MVQGWDVQLHTTEVILCPRYLPVDGLKMIFFFNKTEYALNSSCQATQPSRACNETIGQCSQVNDD
jgi:hypothetical protein